MTTATTFRQDYPYHGMPLTGETTQSNGVVRARTEHGWLDAAYPNPTGKHHRSDRLQHVERAYDPSAALVTTVTTTTQYDAYGNTTSIVVTPGDGSSKVTTNTYANDPASWRLGRLTRSAVQSSAP